MNGILIIDKPQDFTSFDVIAIVRGCMHERKTGHTGTLDPMATGVLPILEVTREQLEEVLPKFRGDIMQKPPMYSAVYKDGVRLYELARKGIEVEREERPANVSLLELTHFDEAAQSGSLKISCSKGTYIRVICDDIGRLLGCGCVMTSLRRTRACGYTLDDAVTLAKLRELAPLGQAEALVKPVDSIFAHLRSVRISEKQTVRFRNGASLMLSRLSSIKNAEDGELFRVYGNDGVFLGLGMAELEKQSLTVRKRFDQFN